MAAAGNIPRSVPFLCNGSCWSLPHLDSSNDEPVVVATVKVRTASPAAVLEQRYNGRKGAEQVRRRRANFGHDPQLTACREVARTHQGLRGGHPGDLHAAPPASCVSASSTTSPVNSFYLPVHTSCAEGMHMSPAARGVNIGTRMKVPGHTAHSAARILHFRPCEARQRLYFRTKNEHSFR